MVLIAVWPLSGFSKKCVDEKTSVERSQSRTGNSIVRGILQVSVKSFTAIKCSFTLFFFSHFHLFKNQNYIEHSWTQLSNAK